MTFIKIIFILLLGYWGFLGAQDYNKFGLLNGVDLVFHEAGHPLFGIFGEVLGMWGGTIMQLLLPFGILIAFLKKKDKYSASVMFWWFGQNFFHIAPYVKDARTQALPLVGGGIHDWGYILGRLNVLHLDQQISHAIWWVGCIVIAISIFLGILFSFEKKEFPLSSSL